MIFTYVNAAKMGVLAGMRSMMAPAFASQQLIEQSAGANPSGLVRFFSSPIAANAFKVMAAGEVFGDKLPFASDRIEPKVLVGRIASGAICGAVVAELDGKKAAIGAVIGGLAAIASSYAFFYLRTKLTEKQGIPDPYLALVEDAATFGLGMQTIRSKN
ncbi:DUF4126 family protein [Tellurirhabdus bombi]|uniref:DUF4126 family protein n=1 Tax=Tellurirhabdus bombi TaxID=2907205 RepID=UPI001F1C3492|nr:DUF4126 family protein [Tellurirhabdus bombi]